MSEPEAVWLARNTGYDHGSVEAILLDRGEARRWIEEAHRAAVAHGKHMEDAEDSDESRMFEPGWWLPTGIEPLEQGEGWCFDEHQGGSGHGHMSIRRIELPYEKEMIWLECASAEHTE